MPTAANLNLHRRRNSCVRWHCDDEPLFGSEVGTSKLIVSVSFGSLVSFKWKAKSCLDGEVGSCCLGHGHILVMDGQCQDEFLHCTDPGLEQERINVTFRWIKRHTASCALRTGVVCCLPTCAQGSSAAVQGVLGVVHFGHSGAPWSLVHMGGAGFAGFPLMYTGLGLRRCAYRWTRPSGGGRWGHSLRNSRGAVWFAQCCAFYCLQGNGSDPVVMVPKNASLSGTAQSPWLLCM